MSAAFERGCNTPEKTFQTPFTSEPKGTSCQDSSLYHVFYHLSMKGTTKCVVSLAKV